MKASFAAKLKHPEMLKYRRAPLVFEYLSGNATALRGHIRLRYHFYLHIGFLQEKHTASGLDSFTDGRPYFSMH